MGDNYAPAVSQVLMDALLDEAYLHLPRMKLYIMNTGGRNQPSSHMTLLDFLFSAGTKRASQVTNGQSPTACREISHHWNNETLNLQLIFLLTCLRPIIIIKKQSFYTSHIVVTAEWVVLSPCCLGPGTLRLLQ